MTVAMGGSLHWAGLCNAMSIRAFVSVPRRVPWPRDICIQTIRSPAYPLGKSGTATPQRPLRRNWIQPLEGRSGSAAPVRRFTNRTLVGSIGRMSASGVDLPRVAQWSTPLLKVADVRR